MGRKKETVREQKRAAKGCHKLDSFVRESAKKGQRREAMIASFAFFAKWLNNTGNLWHCQIGKTTTYGRNILHCSRNFRRKF